MAEVRMVVCDECNEPDATSFIVTRADMAPWTVDLCPIHAEPIMRLRERARSVNSPRRPYHRFQKVTPVETDSPGEVPPDTPSN